MIIRRTTAALAAIGLALSMSLTACSSSPDTQEANAAYCEGAAKVQTEVEKLSSLIEAGSPSDVVKTQWNAVQSAVQANSVPLSQLDKAVQDDIAAADDALTQAIEAIPGDATPAEAAPQYKAAIDAYNSSISTIKAEVGCS
jgi:hypothetical protein